MACAVVTHDVIKGAVVRALSAISAGQPIYDERMLQDFNEPCFFVIETSVSEEPELTPYCFREHRVEVTYFPVMEALSHRTQLSQWRDTIMDALRNIMVDAYVENNQMIRLPVRARNAECRLVEDHITYYANYRIHCRTPEIDDPIMETLIQYEHLG